MLTIQRLRGGEPSPIDWATQATRGAVIIVLSLALYELSRQVLGVREKA